MAARILSGLPLADLIMDQVRETVAAYDLIPGLSVFLCSDDPASKVYVERKTRACAKLGIYCSLIRPTDEERWRYEPANYLSDLIEEENEKSFVNGILLQLPLPAGMRKEMFLDLISPEKDVDCFHPENVGLLLQGRPRHVPCTPYGVCRLLEYYNIPTKGKKVAVINRSDVVGKPLLALLIQDNPFANATVAVCHDHTPPDALRETCLWADIIVVAVGRRKFLTADMVRPGTTVIDVGINRDDEGKVCGDVDFEAVREKCGAISPVPGGVGPLTVAMLMRNTLAACLLQKNLTAGPLVLQS